MALETKQSEVAATIDRGVGERIRQRRILMGLTQDQLADAIDISYQQIQKYETGANRVSAGRLYLIATKLGVSPDWFFKLDGAQNEDIEDKDNSRMMVEVMRYFNRIESAQVRNDLIALMRSLSQWELLAGDGGKVSEPSDAGQSHSEMSRFLQRQTRPN